MLIGLKLGDINSVDTFNNFLRIKERHEMEQQRIAKTTIINGLLPSCLVPRHWQQSSGVLPREAGREDDSTVDSVQNDYNLKLSPRIFCD